MPIGLNGNCFYSSKLTGITFFSSSIMHLQKAGRSLGLLLVISLLSTTTSSSFQSTPALIKSVLIDLYDVICFPFNNPVSINIEPAWQMAAIGFPCLKNSATNFTADSFVRNVSVFSHTTRQYQHVVIG